MGTDADHGGGYPAPGGSSGTGAPVKVSPADVRAIANKHIATAQDAIAAAKAKFESTPDGESGFGAFEAGIELAGLHSSVKTVFTQTVDGVRTDLSSYHQNLIAGADAWEAAEENSADRSRGLTERLVTAAAQPLATNHNWNSSRQEEGERLALGETLSEHAEDGDDTVPETAGQPAGHGEGPAQPAGEPVSQPAAQPGPGHGHTPDTY
jgi:hypothetical protein